MSFSYKGINWLNIFFNPKVKPRRKTFVIKFIQILKYELLQSQNHVAALLKQTNLTHNFNFLVYDHAMPIIK